MGPDRSVGAGGIRPEVVLMEDKAGRVIGFELLHYRPTAKPTALAVETVVQTAP